MSTMPKSADVELQSGGMPARESKMHKAPRVVSIDVFRGMTMAVMIFVNELSGVPGIPWWTEHAPGRLDYMTYVDMVFPFFLFIVGMSMPLSVAERLRKNPSMPALWLHVLSRFLSLLVLGLVLANAEDASSARMGMTGSVWALLTILSAGLYLFVYPRSERFPRYTRILRIFGIAGVILLFAMYRRTSPDGHLGWLEFGYPEILGLIAYSYLAVAALYIPTRRPKWAVPAWLIVFVALNALTAAKWLGGPDHWPWWFWPFSNGSMCAVIFAGILTTRIFLGSDDGIGRRPAPSRAMAIGVVCGLLMLVAGRVFTPLGISKIRATPTWSLYSAGAALLMFTLVYWVCDVKRLTAWAALFRPAGANTLTTYLLPDLWYFITLVTGFTLYNRYFNLGAPAVLKTFAFTLFILIAAALLTKAKVRLEL